MLRNPPQSEDADILEEPNASAAEDVARIAGAGPVVVESGDSEDSGPFRVKRSRPGSFEDRDAAAPVASSAEPSSAPAAPRRNRLWRGRPTQSG